MKVDYCSKKGVTFFFSLFFFFSVGGCWFLWSEVFNTGARGGKEESTTYLAGTQTDSGRGGERVT